MTEEEYLAHFGVLGMKWGKRKAKTPEIEETPAQRRERVLLSTKAKLVYDNRHLLTTVELNERINRINTEQRLAELSALEKTSAQQKIDKILKMGKTANDLYQVYNQPIVQGMINKLSGKTTSINYKKMLENVNDLSTAQITELAKRVKAERAIRSFVEGGTQSDTQSEELEQSDTNSEHLAHYGVKGMKWGVRKTQSNSSTFKNPKNLSDWMKNNIGYSEYTRLKSPIEVKRSKSGSCHDQVMLALSELKKMGLKPKAEFLIEYNPKSNAGGMTHSFVHYEKNGKTYWLENAWGGKEGVHEFSSLDDIKKSISTSHKTGEMGDVNSFPKLEWATLKENHIPGETLSEFVNKTLS